MPLPVRFILYVVRTSPDPDRCDGTVPWRVDGQELFFGPCKKALRRHLRQEFLGPDDAFAHVSRRERIVVAGVNAGHGHQPRKFVFVGEVEHVMSFAEAHSRLQGPRYEAMRAARYSPLHVRPFDEGPTPTGYRRVSEEHADESKEHPGEFSWWDDFVPRPMRLARVGEATTDTLKLKAGVSWWDGFPLDACFTMSNRFWAAGSGLAFDSDSLHLLSVAQHEASEVSASAPFGRDASGSAIGRRGSYLELKGRLAEDMVEWLDARLSSAPAPAVEMPKRAGRPRRRC